MTQEELAEKTGVTRQTILAIQSAKYFPSLELAFRIAMAFRVELGRRSPATGKIIRAAFEFYPHPHPSLSTCPRVFDAREGGEGKRKILGHGWKAEWRAGRFPTLIPTERKKSRRRDKWSIRGWMEASSIRDQNFGTSPQITFKENNDEKF